jgi:hypothetical protein
LDIVDMTWRMAGIVISPIRYGFPARFCAVPAAFGVSGFAQGT